MASTSGDGVAVGLEAASPFPSPLSEGDVFHSRCLSRLGRNVSGVGSECDKDSRKQWGLSSTSEGRPSVKAIGLTELQLIQALKCCDMDKISLQTAVGPCILSVTSVQS